MTGFTSLVSRTRLWTALLAVALLAAPLGGVIGQGTAKAADTNEINAINTPTDAGAQNGAKTGATSVADLSPSPQPRIDADVYGEMFKILFAVFTIALVLESALAVIFNWRLFLVYFDSRGMKTIVSVVAGVLVAVLLRFDVIDRLYKAMFHGGEAGLQGFGYFLTGLILAGGSAGVNKILVGLGFRSLRTEEARLPRPKPTEAWLAVNLVREEAKGPVQVFVTQDSGGERLVGTISGSTVPRFFAKLRTNPMRYPPVAGFAVPADSLVTVQLRDPVQDAVSEPWGPYRVAGGAIIDFELKV